MSQQIAAFSELEQHSQDLALLYDIATAMSQSLDLETILETAVDIVVDRLDMEAVSIFLFDEERRRFVARTHRGLSKRQQAIIERFRRQVHDFAAWVVDNQKVLYAYEASQEKLGRMLWGEASARTMVGLPLLARGGIVGEIGMTSRPGRQFSRQRAEVLLAVSRQIGIAIENALLIEEIRRGEQEARTLYEIGIEISASLELDRVLQVVAEGARKVLAADTAGVGLLDEERHEIVLQAVAGLPDNQLKGTRYPVRAGDRFAALARGEPVLNTEYSPEAGDTAPPYVLLIAPLTRAGRLLGAVGVASHERRHFTWQEAQLLMRLASQMTIAIENARLYQQVRQLAALEERERLARELHDSVAQTLSYLGMQASLAHQQLIGGQSEAAQASLQELSSVAQAAYADVREAIFNLRTTMPAGMALPTALRMYLAEYRLHSGLDARLVVDNERLAELPAEVAAELLRVIQEALTNVRKHARASRVWVCLEREDDGSLIRIEDDGVGFDWAQAAAPGRRRFGLHVMRERAESVGATLTIDSQPGCGTRVLIRIPDAVGREFYGETACPSGR